jgi:hypothetical protein
MIIDKKLSKDRQKEREEKGYLPKDMPVVNEELKE